MELWDIGLLPAMAGTRGGGNWIGLLGVVITVMLVVVGCGAIGTHIAVSSVGGER